MSDQPNRTHEPSLREITTELDGFKDWVLERFRSTHQLLDERFESRDRALGLQYTETMRRLTELNHAHEQAVENWRKSLPRELFEQFEREWRVWREMISKDMTEQRAYHEAKLAMTSRHFLMITGGIGVFVTLLNLVVSFVLQSAKWARALSSTVGP